MTCRYTETRIFKFVKCEKFIIFIVLSIVSLRKKINRARISKTILLDRKLELNFQLITISLKPLT